MPTPHISSSPEQSTLLTLSSIVVARQYPFALIEDRYKNIIPEPVQKSIIYHSFPKRESDVLVYASSDFNAERYGVENVVQIGFHVSGVVYEVPVLPKKLSSSRTDGSRRRWSSDDEGGFLPGTFAGGTTSTTTTSFKVSATFDRGKITGVACNCENESSLIFWCDHVVALALYRIRRKISGVDFVLRVPISETLLQLNRSQLQKLVQYLISDHTDVLPTAQRLADEILFMKTGDDYINRIHGAPDITAGPSPSDPHAWALNEPQIQSQVRVYVSQSTQSTSHPNVINTLIEKAYRMIKSRDNNASRIVQIITAELVRHVSKPQPRATIPPQIWDQITRIWNVLVLKPGLGDAERSDLTLMLERLATNEHVPAFEDASSDNDDDNEKHEHATPPPPKRQKNNTTIFTYALRLLQNRVNPFDYECSVLHSRVCHGNEDTRYALRLVDKLKNEKSRIRIENAHVLFDVLKASHPRHAYEAALVGLTCKARLRALPHVHEKHMKHVEKLLSKIHGMGSEHVDLLNNYSNSLLHDTDVSCFPPISFVTYAFNLLNSNVGYRLALKHLCLNSYAYVHTHVESQQIALATTLLSSSKHNNTALEEISSTIIRVVKSNTSLFRLAQECFKHASNDKLVNVAFNIALHVVKATKYTVHRRRWEMVRWVVSCGVEIGVAKLFYLVRNWGEYFSAVEAVGTVASNILAWAGGSVGNSAGVVAPTLACVTATTVGCPVTSSQQQQQQQSGCLATSKGSSSINDKRVLEELANAARNLAIQCAKNDPQNCALNTLTLCESDGIAFETSYQIVLDSSNKEQLTPQQIFTIARYMEHRGYTQRAYRLAVIALQFVHIGYNQDTHSLISEIHWCCNLSHQLSTPLPPPQPPQQQQAPPAPPPPPPAALPSTQMSTRSRYQVQSTTSSPRYYNSQLTSSQPPHHLPLAAPTTEIENLIPLLIRNIKCATVLTEILRRSIAIMTSYENAYQKQPDRKNKIKHRVYEKLNLLIEGTIDSYITTIHSRLVHISPRHYSDFIEFLGKARENFMLAPNGNDRFNRLVDSMKLMKSLRGKKKLLFLLNERFR